MDSTMDSTMDSRPQTNRRNAHLATEPIRSNFGEVLKVDQLAGCKTLTDNPKVFVLQTNACGEVHESAGWQPHASNHTQPHANTRTHTPATYPQPSIPTNHLPQNTLVYDNYTIKLHSKTKYNKIQKHTDVTICVIFSFIFSYCRVTTFDNIAAPASSSPSLPSASLRSTRLCRSDGVRRLCGRRGPRKTS